MSRIEKLLKAIINNTTYDEPRLSRIEEIFYSILYSLPYNADAQSRIEALLLALKESGLYDERTLSRIEEILKCKLDGSTYTGWIGSRVEMLLNEWELSEIIETTFTSFPIIIKANGEPLLDYTIYGNAVQSGTPTPDNPIMPQGTGERTGNLFNKDKQAGNIYVTETVTRYGVEIPVSAGTYSIVGGTNKLFVKEKYGTTYGTPIHTSARRIITLPQNGYILVYAGTEEDYTVSNVMLNSGSTALPYEPYGYKIQISSANTTTPVYLGEVQTTRKIKKMVLTGEENWTYEPQYSRFILTCIDAYYSGTVRKTPCICSHYQPIYDGRTIDNIPNESIYIAPSSGRTAFNVKSTDFTSVTDFKSYLAAQYAAGTPVTVWYVLATEKTAVVNEPLMKIGDYVDTLSMEQAGAQIPTLNKPNTTVIDVETELKPSEMYVKYNGEGTRVYITTDSKLYITSNNEIYVLKR